MTPYDVQNRLSRGGSGVRNPLKGLRADADLGTRFGTLARWYIPWNEIEKTAADGVEKIIAFGEANWKNASLSNCKIIPRVYLEWPNAGRYWPDDLKTGDYSSTVFRERLKNMVQKMAQAWDNDPQIAYVEMGLIGLWGEQHTPNPTLPVQQVLLDAFGTYFVNKKIMVRYPKCDLFDKSAYGLYWDEWGSEKQWSEWDEIDLLLTDAYRDRWKTGVMGGENTNNLYTYDPAGGRFMTFGCDVPFSAETAFTQYSAEMTKYARLIHANHMHTRLPESTGGLAWMNVCSFQDTLGYAFVLQEARFDHVEDDRALRGAFDVKNIGASPFYYDWPVRVSLLDAREQQPVWSALLPDVSVSDWMPGEQWQTDAKAYLVPAQTYTVEFSLDIPSDVPDGAYILALSIVDPAGLRNAAVFMNAGYIAGGYTALGMAGVGETPAQTLALPSMPIAQSDAALRYDVNLALRAPCGQSALTDGLSCTSAAFEAGGQAVIDLGRTCGISSLTLAFAGDRAAFTVECSRNGETWTRVDGDAFCARGGETHMPIDVRARYVRLTMQDACTLTQARVYGQ